MSSQSLHDASPLSNRDLHFRSLRTCAANLRRVAVASSISLCLATPPLFIRTCTPTRFELFPSLAPFFFSVYAHGHPLTQFQFYDLRSLECHPAHRSAPGGDSSESSRFSSAPTQFARKRYASSAPRWWAPWRQARLPDYVVAFDTHARRKARGDVSLADMLTSLGYELQAELFHAHFRGDSHSSDDPGAALVFSRDPVTRTEQA